MLIKLTNDSIGSVVKQCEKQEEMVISNFLHRWAELLIASQISPDAYYEVYRC